MRQDLRHSIRAIARAKASSAVLLISLGLGTGANAAVYGVLDTLLLRGPVGIDRPGRLVSIYTSEYSAAPYGQSSYADFVSMKGAVTSIAAASAIDDSTVANVRIGDAEQAARIARVSPDLFATLGMSADRGELRLDQQPPSAVVSHTLATELGGSTDIVGQALTIGNQTFVVSGVTPPRFRGLLVGRECDVWIPLTATAAARGDRRLAVIARLVSGDRRSANDALLHLSNDLAERFPTTNRGNIMDPVAPRRFTSRPYSHLDPSATSQTFLIATVIGGAAALLLASACLNAGGLLLSWSVSRRRELAIKMALGATRKRLVTQLFSETLVLSLAGGLVGILFAEWTRRILPALFMGEQAALLDTHLSPSMMLLTVGIACVAGGIFGIAPAWQGTAAPTVTVLRADAGGVSEHRGGGRLRSWLVTSQVALSTVLLLSTGLLVVGLDRALEGDLASTAKRVVVASIDLPGFFGDSLLGMRHRSAVIARALESPGVVQVSWASTLPLGRGNNGTFGIEGPTADVVDSREFDTNVVAPGFFEVLSLRLVEGRVFDGRDTALSAPVAIVDELLARRHFGARAVGEHLVDARGTRLEIVGVVGSGRYRTLQQPPQPTVYYPSAQDYLWRGHVVLRTASDPAPLLAGISKAVDIGGGGRLLRVATLETLLTESLTLDRLTTTLVASCGIIALIMSTVGVYGIMIDAVQRRTREIGLRVALGAGPIAIARLVLMEAAYPATTGLLVGGGIAFAVAFIAKTFVAGIPPIDPRALLAISGLLVAIIGLAAVIPLRRALRVHPNIALRAE